MAIGGGSVGVVAISAYQGFDGLDPQGRRVSVTRFSNPVAPANATSAAGHVATAFLDELGRERRTEVVLGGDYPGASLVARDRRFDAAGRLIFLAEPYAKGEDPATAYGVAYYFSSDGGLACAIRGLGRPPILDTATNLATERLPTCFYRSYSGHRAITEARDAASLQVGSPQFGVIRRSVGTAIGWTIERSTWLNGAPLESATFTYDRLGQRTSMTRFLDPANGAGPVTWSFLPELAGPYCAVFGAGHRPAIIRLQRMGRTRRDELGGRADAAQLSAAV